MDKQKQRCQSKRVVDVAGHTELCKSWPAHNDSAGYEVDSKHHADNLVEPTPSHGSHNGLPAKSNHTFPSGSIKAAIQLPPSTTPPSPNSISDYPPDAEMLIPACKHFTEQLRMALKYAVSHPPVTSATLIELDLNWIVHNMHLRSDINFETDLHFMPVKGKRAEQKGKEAQQYWLALAAELQIHVHSRIECAFSDGTQQTCAPESFTPRLPQMFSDLRELLETLVPEKDYITVAENLDMPFMMQQIENGVLDISRLAKWLASLLKSHCAPMRDEWADQMTQQIEEGSRNSDMTLLVKGIGKLFSVLEAMKLVRILVAHF
jgi:T-complex protein 11